MRAHRSLAFLLAASLALAAAAVARSADNDRLWLNDLDAAKQQAAQSGKPLLILFTGSDWCPPCIALEKEVLTKPRFAKWAPDRAVLLLLDFPHKKQLDENQKRHNEQAKATYKPRSFPTFIVLDSAGNEKSRWVGYTAGQGAEKWIELASSHLDKARS